MIYAFLAISVISILCNLFAVIFIMNARQAAKESVVDTMRLNAIITELFTVVPNGMEPEWGVIHKGAVVAQGYDLRAVLDEADNKVSDHG